MILGTENYFSASLFNAGIVLMWKPQVLFQVALSCAVLPVKNLGKGSLRSGGFSGLHEQSIFDLFHQVNLSFAKQIHYRSAGIKKCKQKPIKSW